MGWVSWGDKWVWKAKTKSVHPLSPLFCLFPWGLWVEMFSRFRMIPCHSQLLQHIGSWWLIPFSTLLPTHSSHHFFLQSSMSLHIFWHLLSQTLVDCLSISRSINKFVSNDAKMNEMRILKTALKQTKNLFGSCCFGQEKGPFPLPFCLNYGSCS